jgi:exodeoxyribonuclease VII small subunit
MNGAAHDSGPAAEAAAPERFDDLLVRLRTLVERLEGGPISLEDGLRCFEEGMTLCRRGAEILDRAERRVEVLLSHGPDGPRTAPFDAGAVPRQNGEREGEKEFNRELARDLSKEGA